MRYKHEEIKEKLPDYLNCILDESEIKEIEKHLNICDNCREEFSCISELKRVVLPDPGEFYWNNLPVRVSKHVTEGRKVSFFSIWLFRPVPAIVSALLITAVIITLIYTTYRGSTDGDILFNDPFVVSYLDLSDVAEEDISTTIEEDIGDEIIRAYYSEDFPLYSYHVELTSLNSEELKNLYKVLNNKESKGG